MINTELLNIKNDFAITTEILEEIKKPFYPFADEFLEQLPKIDEVLEKGKDEINIDSDLEKKAKRLKHDIAKIRTSTGKVKDSEKKEVLQRGNAIQACHNVIVRFIEEKEESLEKIIKFAENKEKERIANLQKLREEKLKPYITEIFDLANLGEMEDDRFEAYFLGKKIAYEENQKEIKRLEDKRIENERIAEEKRIELIKENARIEAEAKVQKDKIEAEMRQKYELERVEREKKKAIERVEREKKEAIEKAEKDKQDEIARIKKEQEDKDRLEQKRKDDEENARIEKQKQDKIAEDKRKQDKLDKIEELRKEKELQEKRNEFVKYRESLDYDHFEDKDGKRIFYKKVGEFTF